MAVLARMKGAASTTPYFLQKIIVRPWAAGIIMIAALCGGEAAGQPAAPATQIQLTNDDLSKESENPVSLVITLPLRYEADFRMAPTTRPRTPSNLIRPYSRST